jgi:hypothetical protein
MFKITHSAVLAIAFVAGMFTSFCVGQQQSAIASAPVPAQIFSARKIFVSNAPGDFAPNGDYGNYGPYRPYNKFYAGLKDWGYYELVSAPADADLVFEIRFVERPITHSLNWPQFLLTIVDPKTHVTLWWINESIQAANRVSTDEKHYATAMTNLIDDVKKLAGQSGSSVDANKK